MEIKEHDKQMMDLLEDATSILNNIKDIDERGASLSASIRYLIEHTNIKNTEKISVLEMVKLDFYNERKEEV